MKLGLRFAFAAGTLMLSLAVIPSLACAQAQAPQAGVKAGFLTCHVSKGFGLIFGSSRTLKCVYSPAPGVRERYVGEITKFGIDIGYLDSAVMMWEVVAPTTDIEKGDLAGTYAGPTAGGSLGVGGGVNILVGGFHESFALQPISIEGNNGLNLAAGIASLRLRAAPDNDKD